MKTNFTSFLIGGLFFLGGLLFFSAKISTAKSKVGNINTQELWKLMPEKKVADEKLLAIEKELVDFIKAEQETFNKGVVLYQRDSLNMSDMVKKQTYNKLVQQQEVINSLPEQANKELQKKQQELYDPILKKMQAAIDAVSARNGFDYIIDVSFGNVVYTKNTDDNILPLVKAELGLQ